MDRKTGTTREPKTAQIRLLAIDLDGTLLNDSKQVSEQTSKALLGLPERGVYVVIASARPPRSVRHIYSMLKLNTWQINYNGAMIWDEGTRSVVFHRPMTGTLVRHVIDFARNLHPDVLASCEILDRWHTDRYDPTYSTETGRLFKPDVIAPLKDICTGEITKLMLLGDPFVIGRISPLIAEKFKGEIGMVQTDPDLIQIMDKRVGKSAALKKVAAHYRVPMAQVMAIGDAPNDVGMLQLAGVAVAMDNAHARVKRVAHWVAPSNNDHGVHAALVKYGLCES